MRAFAGRTAGSPPERSDPSHSRTHQAAPDTSCSTRIGSPRPIPRASSPTERRCDPARSEIHDRSHCSGLEHELQSELNDARITSHRDRSCNSPEVGAVGGNPVVIWRRARNVEVHLVEDVEELYAELNVHIVVVTEVLEQPHIPGMERRPVQKALWEVAERAGVGHREGRRVEPKERIRTGWRFERL